MISLNSIRSLNKKIKNGLVAALFLVTQVGATTAPFFTEIASASPTKITAKVHQGQKSDLSYTSGNITQYTEGDYINFRLSLDATHGPTSGEVEVRFTGDDGTCTFFDGSFALGAITSSGPAPTVTVVGVPVATDFGTSNGEWVQKLNISYPSTFDHTSNETVVNYTIRLSDEAGECNGSSQHSRLNPSGGTVEQSGAQNVPVPANQIIELPEIFVQKWVDTNGDGIVDRKALAEEWSFSLDSGTPVSTDANGNVTFTNVTPNGNHTVTESNGPAGQQFLSGSGTNCTFQGAVATANVAEGTTAQDATCIFNNGIQLGSITIIKDAQPNAAQDFAFTATGNGVSNFSLDDDSDPTLLNTTTFSNLVAGTYSFTETGVSGWSLSSATCTDGSTVSNVQLSAGENITCTFINTRDTGSVKVNKLLDNDGNGSFETTNPSSFNWSLDGSGTNAMGSTVSGIETGTHSVNENTVTDYHLVGWYYTSDTSKSCANPDSTTLPASLSVTKDTTTEITICNQRDAGVVSFLKTVIGGTSVAGDWTFNISDGTTAKSGDSATYVTGTYTVTESGPSGYTLTGVSGICSLSVGVITMTVTTSGGQCHLTNTRDTGSVKVNKLLDNDGNGSFETTNPSSFNWSLDGSGTNAMGSTVSGIETGTHSVNENTVTDYHLVGWYYTSDTSKSCANPDSTTLPASLSVTKDTTTEITICNARDMGTITVNKVVNPSNDDGLFNLQIDGSTAGTGANVGDGGTTGSITLPTGSHTVSEVAGDNTNLDDYISSFSCSNQVTGNGTSTGGFTLSTDEDVTCTFTNVRKATLTVVKDAQPNDAQDFNFTIDSFVDLRNLVSLDSYHKAFVLDDDNDATLSNTEITNRLTPGAYTIHEDPTTGWTLENVTCGEGVEFEQEGNDIVVWLAPGADMTCTFTNTRDTGTITVVKQLTPETNAGKFNLNINGTTYATNVGDNGTTSAISLPTGDYVASETAGTNTTLSDYETSYQCMDGDVVVASGNTSTTSKLTLTKNQNIVCTFFNNKGEILGETVPALVNTGSNILLTSAAGLLLISSVIGVGIATRRATTARL